MHSTGQDEEAIKTNIKPKERKIIKLDVKIFNNYEGLYASEEGIEIIIKQKNSKFYAQIKGQPEFEIFPESRTRFFFKVFGAEVEFLIDRKGKVTGLNLHQGGRYLKMCLLEGWERIIGWELVRFK